MSDPTASLASYRKQYEACSSSAVKQMAAALRVSGRILDNVRVQFAAVGVPPGSVSGDPPLSGSFSSAAIVSVSGPSRGLGAAGAGQKLRRSRDSAAAAAGEQQQQLLQEGGIARQATLYASDLAAFCPLDAPSHRQFSRGTPLGEAVRSQKNRQLECVSVITNRQKADNLENAEGTQELQEYLTKPIPVQLGLQADNYQSEQKRQQDLISNLKENLKLEREIATSKVRLAARVTGCVEDIERRSKQQPHALFPEIRRAEGSIIAKPEFLDGWAEPVSGSFYLNNMQHEPQGLVARTPHNVTANWLRVKPSSKDQEETNPDEQKENAGGQKKIEGIFGVMCAMATQTMDLSPAPLRSETSAKSTPTAGARRMKLSSAIPPPAAPDDSQPEAPQVVVIREGKTNAIVTELEFDNSVKPQGLARKNKPKTTVAVQTEAPPAKATPTKETAKVAAPSSSSKSRRTSLGLSTSKRAVRRGVWLSSSSSQTSTDNDSTQSDWENDAAESDSSSSSSSSSNIGSSSVGSSSSSSTAHSSDSEEKALNYWQQALEEYTQQLYAPLGDILQRLPQRYLPPLSGSAAASAAAAVGDPLEALGLGMKGHENLQRQLATNPYLFLCRNFSLAFEENHKLQFFSGGDKTPVLPALGAPQQGPENEASLSAAATGEDMMRHFFGDQYLNYFGDTMWQAFPAMEVPQGTPFPADSEAFQHFLMQQQLSWPYMQQQQQEGTEDEGTDTTPSSPDKDSSSSSSNSNSSRWRRQQRQLLPLLQNIGRRQHLPITRGGRRTYRGPPECLKGGPGEQIDVSMLPDKEDERVLEATSSLFKGAPRGPHGRPRRPLRGRHVAVGRLDIGGEKEKMSPLEVQRRLGLRPKWRTHQQGDETPRDIYEDVLHRELTSEEEQEAAEAERRRTERLQRQLRGLMQCALQETDQEQQQQQQQQQQWISSEVGRRINNSKLLAKAMRLKKRIVAADLLLSVERTAGMLAAKQRVPFPSDVVAAMEPNGHSTQQETVEGKAEQQQEQQQQQQQQQEQKQQKQRPRGSPEEILGWPEGPREAKGLTAHFAEERQADALHFPPGKSSSFSQRPASPTFGSPQRKSTSSSSKGAAQPPEARRSAAAIGPSSSSSRSKQQIATSNTHPSAAAAARGTATGDNSLPDIRTLSRQAGVGRPVGRGNTAAAAADAAVAESVAELLQQLKQPAASTHREFSWEQEPIPALKPRRRLEELTKQQQLEQQQQPQQRQQEQQQQSAVAAKPAFSWEEKPIPTLRPQKKAEKQQQQQAQEAPRYRAQQQPPTAAAATAAGKRPFLQMKSGAGGGQYHKLPPKSERRKQLQQK